MVGETSPGARGDRISTIGKDHRLALDQTASSADDRRGHRHNYVHVRPVEILKHWRNIRNLGLGVGAANFKVFPFLKTQCAQSVEDAFMADFPTWFRREIGEADFEGPA